MNGKLWIILGVLLISSAWAGKVRVTHLAPLATAVDVYMNGELRFPNIPFRSVTRYLPVLQGLYDIEVFRTGTREKPIIVARDIKIDDGTYTITAAGRGDDKSYFPIIFRDDLQASPNQAEVRIINASPDLRSIDLGIRGGIDITQGVAYKSASNYLRFGPGTYNLEVRLSGLHTPMVNITALKLESGKVYTLFVVGLLEDNTLNYVLSEDTRPN